MEYLRPDPNLPQGRYARVALRHLQVHRPMELQTLQRNGTLMGWLERLQRMTLESIEARMQELKQSYPIKMTPGKAPSYLDLVRREQWARMTAEEELLPTMILTPPESLQEEVLNG